MSLLDKLSVLVHENCNVAYFCTFDRKTATRGTEHLYTGNESFLPMNSIDESTSEHLRESFNSGPEIPVIFPYDYITQVFPGSGIRRSGWPLMLGFIPEASYKSEFKRSTLSMEFTKPYLDTDLDFSSLVRTLRSRIISGEILQGVLSRRFELPSVDIMERLGRFLNADRSLYVFFLRIGDFMLLGSSPENLITVRGEHAEIFPIAGTVPRGMNMEEDEIMGNLLLASQKDKLEHRMLVDLARNDLGKISMDGTVEVTQSMELRKYASVQHLVSRVESSLSGKFDPISIVNAVFPAGTVSGAPKRRAAEIIDSMEPFPRGGYAGASGVVGRKKLDLALSIRSVFGSHGSIYTQAGAGIVKDSDPDSESREVMNKLHAVVGGMKYDCIDR